MPQSRLIRTSLVFAAVAILALFAQGQATDSAYAPANSCAACHRAIWDTYRQTGMGRAFSLPSPQTVTIGTYYHKPSDSHFTILDRGGRYYQRRHQLGTAGGETNVFEKSIDYVMGSGNHARTFLHRTPRGTLVELPLGWYAEDGGTLAMNPGYDASDHEDFRRPISYECMFCHNGYPRIPSGHDQPFAEPVYLDPVPQGIDCQRCHGPGARHAAIAGKAGAEAGAIRAAIINPARLPRERREEVCVQCHLETTSFPLPNSILRYDRGPFSYKPGEPLGASWLFFDHARGAGRDDKFEIVNAVYRMRKSRCYLESKGRLECGSCHDPHAVPRGEQARRHYDAACRQCHAAASTRHPAELRADRDCAACHMPKRRTEDVVHSLATDHLIQRRSPANATALRAERHERGATAYRGEVVRYETGKSAPDSEHELYTALAQVIERSNLPGGIPRLRAALAQSPNARAEFHLGLAEALNAAGQLTEAMAFYRQAAQRSPRSAFVMRKLGIALRQSGRLDEALQVLEAARGLAASDPVGWHELGLLHRARGEFGLARAAFEKAIALDPDRPEPHGNLGALLLASGDPDRAGAALREAIRIQPDYSDAHDNLANLLAAAGDFPQARAHFEIALRLRPSDARTHYNFAMALGRARLIDEARQQLESAVRADPAFLEARLVLADLLVATQQPQAAIPHLREAVRLDPASSRAQLGLGIALASSGDSNAAVPHLRKAATSTEPPIRDAALQILRQLGVPQ
ncbi:MAG: tetratricopeptide repeat protein [Acidobacteria bacterium]|nr:tetratricopeptide repeat protein [Acidobacteriota bacterium]